MKSTRDRILQTLLTNPRSTINQLAQAVEINAISVRHHLASLQAEGLVSADEERHGVGRPRLVYSLTEQGIEKFPTRYLNLTDRLLDQLRNTLPEDEIREVFIKIARNLANEYEDKMKGLTIPEKLDYLKEILAGEGFSIRWMKQGKDYYIQTVSCPYYHLSQNHPVICMMDQTLISSVLNLPIRKTSSISSGEEYCTYVVQDTFEAERKS